MAEPGFKWNLLGGNNLAPEDLGTKVTAVSRDSGASCVYPSCHGLPLVHTVARSRLTRNSGSYKSLFPTAQRGQEVRPPISSLQSRSLRLRVAARQVQEPSPVRRPRRGNPGLLPPARLPLQPGHRAALPWSSCPEHLEFWRPHARLGVQILRLLPRAPYMLCLQTHRASRPPRRHQLWQLQPLQSDTATTLWAAGPSCG